MAQAHEITKVYREPHNIDAVLVHAICSACGFTVIKLVPVDDVTQPSGLIDDHLAQHVEPAEAPDIDIEWTISAECSICDDGGDVYTDDYEAVTCSKCDTTWNIDGTNGELQE